MDSTTNQNRRDIYLQQENSKKYFVEVSQREPPKEYPKPTSKYFRGKSPKKYSTPEGCRDISIENRRTSNNRSNREFGGITHARDRDSSSDMDDSEGDDKSNNKPNDKSDDSISENGSNDGSEYGFEIDTPVPIYNYISEHRRWCRLHCRNEQIHFNRWVKAYQAYLGTLYCILTQFTNTRTCEFPQNKKSQSKEYNSTVNYQDFVQFVYFNSSKYISNFIEDGV